MEAILVTGSTGLIGSAVVRGLAEGYRMVGFDRATAGMHPRPEAECVCMDLTEDRSVELALQRVRYAYGGRIASVVHLAAYYVRHRDGGDRDLRADPEADHWCQEAADPESRHGRNCTGNHPATVTSVLNPMIRRTVVEVIRKRSPSCQV